jgi:hypothetical protein
MNIGMSYLENLKLINLPIEKMKAKAMEIPIIMFAFEKSGRPWK